MRLHFPLVQQAFAARTIASGEALSASGAFDHKLEGYSNSQPLDFYENSWHNIGVKRDTFWGGQTFAGYRIGRGAFEPWYLERETNKGGEFKVGFVAPLSQDRAIDANRAELWRAQLETGRVEPEIRALVIRSIREANLAYWQWVAAAANYQIASDVLQLGIDRTGFLNRQVELGEKASIELVDNERIIVSRQAKQVDARRKLEQSAVKLSLFFRDDAGNPIVLPNRLSTSDFPEALPPAAWGPEAAVQLAPGESAGACRVANRPKSTERVVKTSMQRDLAAAGRGAARGSRRGRADQFQAGQIGIRAGSHVVAIGAPGTSQGLG